MNYLKIQLKDWVGVVGRGGGVGGGKEKIIFKFWFREWEVSGSEASATALARF